VTISSVKIIANNIYMSGAEFGGVTNTATYWKNGTGVPLTNGYYTAGAYDIAVYGNDIYVAGTEHNGSVYEAKYWKNGVATSLSNNSGNGILWGITVR